MGRNFCLEKENNQISLIEKKSKGEHMRIIVISLMAMLILSNCGPRVIPGQFTSIRRLNPST